MKSTVNFWALLLATVLMCLSEAYAQSGWFSQSSGTTNTLNGVSFTDANTGTAVGNVGTILRTTNGGALWTTQTSGTTFNLLRVSFIDANTGTAVGAAGRILRTTNGGATWASQTSGTTNSLYGVSFTDANTGTAAGSNGTILRTTNGGATWVSQSSGTTNILLAVSFTDANTGTAVGNVGTILRTTNGGATWVSQSSGTTNALLGVSFTDANTGTAVGSSGTIRRTTNGGVVSVEEERHADITGGFLLSQNHPNPFNPSTTIAYALPRQSHVVLTIYNILGQEVVRLVEEMQEPGTKSVMWNGHNAAGSSVSSGVYFYRLEAASGESAERFAQIRRLMVLK